MSDDSLIYEVDQSVATITLNRPERYNALTMDALEALKSAFTDAGQDATVRAVILTGTGKGFSTGADLVEMADQLDELDIAEMLRTGLNALVTQIRQLEKPVICAVNGVAAGAGASLALATDYRIASEQASFVFAAFVNIGLIPDAGGTYLLQQLVGPAKALELSLFADSKNRLDAHKAQAMGIVNQVVAHDNLLQEALILAGKLATMPTRAISLTKRAIYSASERSFSEALGYEASLQAEAFHTHDFREGVAAFLEKRKPAFKGE